MIGESLEFKGLVVETYTRFEAVPARAILDHCSQYQTDLIAMSTHGRSGIGRWVLGSVTDKVLHAGDTPVLVVRATGE
jgi:nucleotide-binding universal stress UspA family protein